MQPFHRVRFRRRFTVPVVPALLLVLLSLCATPADAYGCSCVNPIVAALTRAAHPLASTQPGGGTADLEPLGRAVGNAVIVGVGEATHGSHQFWTFQDRAFRYLVAEKHFASFAREAGWNAGLRINAWVLTGKGDIRQIMREVFQSSDRLWNSQEYLDLFEWMRAYNTRHTHPVQFTGDDIYPVEPEIYDRVLAYAAGHCPDQYPVIAGLYRGHPTGSVGAATDAFKALPRDERLDFATRAEWAYKLLRTCRPGEDGNTFAWRVQDARVIAQDTRFLSFDSETQRARQDLYRDAQMAANLTWWYEHTGGKTMLTAHDGHVALVTDDPENYPRPQGAFLRDRFGRGYISIRMGFGGGYFYAFDYETGRLGVHSTGPVPPESNEHTLNKVPYRDYYLQMRTVRPPARQWLNEARPTFEFGAVWTGQPGPLPDAALRPICDVLIYLHHVDAAHLLPQ